MSDTKTYKYGDKVTFPEGIKQPYSDDQYMGILPNTKADFVRAVNEKTALVRITDKPETDDPRGITYAVGAKVQAPFCTFEKDSHAPK